MFISRARVAFVSVCVACLSLGTALQAQSLAELAAAAAARKGTTEKKAPVVFVRDDRGGQRPAQPASTESAAPDSGAKQGELTQRSAEHVESIRELEYRINADVRALGDAKSQLRQAEIDYKRAPKRIGSYDRVMAVNDQVKKLEATIQQNRVTVENLRGDMRVLDGQAKVPKEPQ